MHFGIVLAWEPEHIHYFTDRLRIPPVPTHDADCDLGPRRSPGTEHLSIRHRYVIRHYTALHEHPCLFAHDLENADERFSGTLHYGNYLALTMEGRTPPFPDIFLSAFLFADNDPDQVPVQCAAHFRWFHENVFFLAFYYDKTAAFACHLNFPDKLLHRRPIVPVRFFLNHIVLHYFCKITIFGHKYVNLRRFSK